MEYMYIICVWKICVWNFGLELFGSVVVLNGGKICIDKMLGFRRDVVKNFPKPYVFVLAISWLSLIQIE